MSNEIANVRLQNLRDFTVQIRRPSDDTVVGTGIAVTMDGQVVTCAHVVEAALGVHPRDADGAAVGIYFPQVRGGEEKARRAAVARCFPQHDDDVVLLQLADGPSPLAPEQIPKLGRAEESCYHPFRSYGYRRLEDYIAGHAHGLILDCVPPPEGRNVQAEPVQLESQQINRGMSGAAVLDIERNLVVGVVSETWFPDRSTKDRDTAWAVNARVLSLEPLGLELQDEPYPKRAAPQPKTDIAAARAAVAPDLGLAWNNAPAPLEEWAGREELLQAITRHWADPDRHATGLIGFGGEGKSSLVRQSVDDLLGKLATCPTLDGVFWWGFYDRPSVDEFFEAALTYMSGGRIDPRKLPSASVRAQVIGAMLGAGRYLFILDGLEVMQHQEGDRYGLLVSADLREFLSYLAAPGHPSFCLITSRAPVLDLMDYTTYTHRDVTRLSPADGRALLRRVGVKGPDEALDRVVADWDGHALTLGLLGGYLAEQHGGDVAYIGEIPPPVPSTVEGPTADEPRYERVHRVLRRYDNHLTEAERAFLTLFSAFRTPVEEAAFEKVFRADMGADALKAPVAALDDAAFAAMVQRLVTYRILRHDLRARHYTAHPLIRNHYAERLKEADIAQVQAAHQRIKDYYLDLAGDTPYHPTLDDLAPLIEAVHHACRAGAYDEAAPIIWNRIYQGRRRVIYHELGAYNTLLAIMLGFFPGSDTSQEPQVSDPKAKSWILNEVGLCLMNLGRLGEAVPFYERAAAMTLDMGDWSNASADYQNLASLHVYLGALAASAEAASEALALARRAENKEGECDSLARQAWAAHLCGDLEVAGAAFQQAEALQQEIDSTERYLYSNRGIFHADHLRRVGDPSTSSGQAAAYARRIAEANLEICERNRVVQQISQCHRVLGDLDADAFRHGSGQAGQHDRARAHYDEALKIARGITYRPALVEALLARGRWAARHGDLTPNFCAKFAG
jgi:tetratricopeptide (TPR) repeat protein